MINPYDRCVADKIINGRHCTIAWYVDNNKLSHMEPQTVTDILEIIKKYFGDLVIYREKSRIFSE